MRPILTAPSTLTPEQRAKHEADRRSEWEAQFVARIRYALLHEPALSARIVAALGEAMRADDRLSARVRKALPKRKGRGRPGSKRASLARLSFATALELLEAHAPGKRGNRAHAIRIVAEQLRISTKSVERAIAAKPKLTLIY